MPVIIGFGIHSPDTVNPRQGLSVQCGDAQSGQLLGTAGVAHGAEIERYAGAQVGGEGRGFGRQRPAGLNVSHIGGGGQHEGRPARADAPQLRQPGNPGGRHRQPGVPAGAFHGCPGSRAPTGLSSVGGILRPGRRGDDLDRGGSATAGQLKALWSLACYALENSLEARFSRWVAISSGRLRMTVL